MNAREVALHVVRDVFPASGRGRGAQEALSYRVQRAALDGRDRAFATELAYGAIKMRRALDWHLRPFLGERAATIPPTTREILRLAMYELRYTRADVHATVYEFVELAKRHGHRGLTGLANAVLRAAIRDPQPVSRASFENDDEYLGTLHSLPTWLVRQWRASFGHERLERICVGVNGPAQTALTVNRLHVTCERAAAALRDAGVETVRSAFVPESLVVASAAAPLHDSPPEGTWWLQSESSALAAEVLQPQPGEHIADLCSGRGNKALQIGARMEGEGELVCVDRDDRKLRVLQARAEACGISLAPVAGDAREAVSERRFDRALLDAPCSGIGVVGRHPEARWIKQDGDGARLAPLQAELLEAAAGRLYEGGALVYAVCSTDPREGAEVVDAFLRHANFSRGFLPATLEPFLTDAGDVLVPPGIDGRDGFYIARLERSL